MIEAIAAFGLLVFGMFEGNAQIFIAAGLFAIACNLQKKEDKA